MAPLAPVPAEDISALYDSRTRQLVLDAQGTLPGIWLPPFFEREDFTGGLLFSLRSYTTGRDPPPETKFSISSRTSINLPIPHFNNKSVQVQTGLGSFAIDIKYTGIPGPVTSQNGVSNGVSSGLDGDAHKDGHVVSDVVTPIPQYLTGDADLRITAQIPKPVGTSTTSIRPSFNPEYLKIVNSSYEDGEISWIFRWAKLPIGSDDQNPQILDITRKTWNGLVGPAATTSIIVQPYIVHFVVLK